jgi:perosamine synthetase
MINIYNPEIKKYISSAIDAIQDGWISNHGKFVELSTNKLNKIVESKYSILMANGTCTTHCLFLALKYKYPNIQKVYVPNNCYVAAWNAALMVYQLENIEVMKMDMDTWNINVEEDYIRSLNENSAVLIVHNLGNIVNVPRLKLIRPDLIFVEDNCEGMFGNYEDCFSGMSESSLCSSCSFYGNKIITTGEGGAFFTQDEEIYKYIKSVYSQGMSETRYLHNLHAYNYRMTNVEAAFLYDQLKDMDIILENKRKIFSNYENLLQELIDLGKIKLMKKEKNTKNAPWIFALRILNNDKSIDKTAKFFKENNVDVRPFFYPINEHDHLKSIENKDLTSYLLNKEVLMIPSSPSITFEEQKEVVNVLYKFLFNLNNIEIVEMNQENKQEIYDTFLGKINHTHFRYFNHRNIDCLNNHVVSIVLYDKVNQKYFGYAHIDKEENYWFGIYIDDAYQNKKLGSLLMNTILKHKSLNDINSIYLTVDKDNKNAIKVYEKYGFKIIQEKEMFYKMALIK